MKLSNFIKEECLSYFIKRPGENDIIAIQSPSGEKKLLCLADPSFVTFIPDELREWEVVAEIKTDAELDAWNSANR